jgi:UDP-glucose 4-epimerase
VGSGKINRVLVTGGAGFIGSHFCDQALKRGLQVVAFDDLSTGRIEFLQEALKNPSFQLVKGDILNLEQLQKACSDFRPELVVHLAANADVRRGLERPRRDLDYNTIGTWNTIESARQSGCLNIIFSSTGSVYGEPSVFPTPEDCPFPVQTSLYAASKLAGEGILSAYSIGYGMNVVVFRFVSILGPRYTHGHIFDFMQSLKRNPRKLRVLGNGLQLKSYLYIDDLMAGLWMMIENSFAGYNVFNIGHDDAMTVNQSLSYIVDELKLTPEFEYSGGVRGWVGDSPRIQLDARRLNSLGWSTTKSLEQSVRATVHYLLQNSWLFNDGDLP